MKESCSVLLFRDISSYFHFIQY